MFDNNVIVLSNHVHNNKKDIASNKLDATVISFDSFRNKQNLIGDRKQGAFQIYKNNNSESDLDANLSQRIEKIKSSINRINQLMLELKNISNKPNT